LAILSAETRMNCIVSRLASPSITSASARTLAARPTGTERSVPMAATS
jgi:hypothetical protein